MAVQCFAFLTRIHDLMMRGSAHHRLVGLFVLVTFLFTGGAWSFSGSGSGSIEDPFIITNVDQLQEMSDDLGAYYSLGNDIDASDTVNRNDGAGFEPVGDATTTFTGGLDGQGHTISNLFIDRPSTDYVGLFGQTSGATIQNVTMEGGSVTGQTYVGGLVGHTGPSDLVSNCYVTGAVSGSLAVGGLVGYTGSSDLVSDCYATGVVSGSLAVGGLVGENHCRLSNCYATGTVSGVEYIGGLVGGNFDSVENCYAMGEVSGAEYVGGLVGGNDIGSPVEACFATGAVFGPSIVGGLVGRNLGSIENCYATGVVSSTGSNIGGLVGLLIGTISKSYATGAVSGSNVVGGLVGKSDLNARISNCYATGPASGSATVGGLGGIISSGTVTHCYSTGVVSGMGSEVGGLIGLDDTGTYASCYWDVETSDTTDGVGNVAPDPPGVTGKTTADMRLQATFSGWSFDLTWLGDEGNDYPKLGFFSVSYLITTLEQLQKMNFDLEGEYVLGADIDASDTASWNGGAGFLPIAPYENLAPVVVFRGSLDGQGHTIADLFINRPSLDYVGLFGRTSEATIVNVTMETGSVTGQSHVGGLVGNTGYNDFVSNCCATGIVSGSSSVGGLIGKSNSPVSNCYATCAVSGRADAGGLVGGNYLGGLVSDCYATGAVSGGKSLGGLLGINFDRVENCYATGVVSGTGTEIGGLIGEQRGTVSKCYAMGAVSGSSVVGGLVGKSDSGGQLSNCYAMGAASASGTVGGLVGTVNSSAVTHCYSTGPVSGAGSEVGGLVGRNDNDTGTFTACYWDTDTTPTTGFVIPSPNPPGVTGKTTVEMQQRATFFGWNFLNAWAIDEGNDYPRFGNFPVSYTITTLQELQNMNFDLDGDYILANDIDASDTINWNDGAGFLPIAPDVESDSGHQGGSFTGSLDGQGHTITGLFINRPSTDYVGLFGQTSGATIQNVTMEGGIITGLTRVGGLVGYNIEASDVVSNCYATGAVSGSEEIGGLIGTNFGEVKNCSTMGEVSGTANAIGGLVGENRGVVSNCNARGAVSGSLAIGGLAAENHGTVSNCYATGTVSGEGLVGGLIGDNIGPNTVSNCYATGAASGGEYVGGLIGSSNGGATVSNCYAMGAVSATATVGGLIGTINSSAVTHCYSTGAVSGMGSEVGGFVGRDATGTFAGCYWDTDTAGLDGFFGSKIILAGITGRTTIEMQQQATFFGWDFRHVWGIDEGNDYPKLGVFSVAYTITTLQQLQSMNFDLGGDYILANDIDASDTTTWNGGAGFDPIGDNENRFTGSFDGQGFAIADLFIDRPTTEFIGLFGHFFGNSLMNVGLEGGNVTGRSAVGSLVGLFSNGAVSKCYTTGIVSGSKDVGGLVGLTDRSSVSDCYAMGTVSGSSTIGGLVGWNIGTGVSNCYATCLVLGLQTKGGLVGQNDGGSYTSCYWDTDTSTTADGVASVDPDPSGVTGKLTSDMFQQVTFEGWGFNSIWFIDEGNDYPRFMAVSVPTPTATPTTTSAPTFTETPINTATETPTDTPTEAPSPTCISGVDDTVFNLDGISGIDARDLLLLCTALKEDNGNSFDLDCSGETDIFDLFQFSRRWHVEIP